MNKNDGAKLTIFSNGYRNVIKWLYTMPCIYMDFIVLMWLVERQKDSQSLSSFVTKKGVSTMQRIIIKNF